MLHLFDNITYCKDTFPQQTRYDIAGLSPDNSYYEPPPEYIILRFADTRCENEDTRAEHILLRATEGTEDGYESVYVDGEGDRYGFFYGRVNDMDGQPCLEMIPSY